MSEKNDAKRRFDIQVIFRFAPVIGFVLLVVFFAVMSKGKSVSTANLKILFNQVVFTALISIGGIFAFSAGAMDMSMSGSVCCAAVAAAIIGNAANSTVVMTHCWAIHASRTVLSDMKSTPITGTRWM